MANDMPWVQAAYATVLTEVRANRLAHALLVQGEQGVGIESLAETVAQFRLCHQSLDYACGQCKSCLLQRAGTHPDIKTIEPSGAGDVIKVDQIREAVAFLSQTPQIGEWKLVCITAAHRMNLNASNALLKVLEEPAGNSLLILVTDRPQLLIPTVRSRCRKLVVTAPSETEAKNYCLAEGITEEQFDMLLPLLGPRPLKICEWVRDGHIARWTSLSEGIENYLSGRLTTGALTDALKDLGVQEMLEWMMRLAAAEATKSAVSAVTLKWTALYEWLAKVRQDTERGTNPNRQLLLDEAFLRWKAASVAGKATAR